MALEDRGAQHDKIVVDKFADPIADYTMTTRDYVLRPTVVAAPIVVTLPPVAEAKGRIYSIAVKGNVDATNTVTIQDNNNDSEGWESDIIFHGPGKAQLFYSDGLKWMLRSFGTDIWVAGVLTGAGANAIGVDVRATGAIAVHAIDVTMTDVTVTTAGDAAGLHLGVTYTGDHTGTGWKTAVAIDYQITGNSTYAFAQSIWVGDCGDAVINYLVGHYVYMEDVGAGATVAYSYNLSLNQNAANATYAGIMRVYNHGGTAHSVIHLANNGGTPFTNLLHFEGGVPPWSNGAPGDMTADAKIACDVGGTTYYIALYL